MRVRVFDAADCPPRLPDADLVIDAAYGTGFRGEWRAPRVGAAPVLAVDIPSGVDGLTGEAARGVLPADRTVTFAALKPGLVLAAGRNLAGDVEVVDIGLDTARARAHVVEAGDVAAWWRPRPPTAHKWSRAVRIVAGSPGMTGAAFLAAGAAQRAGSGMVSLSSPGVEADGSARGGPPPAPGVRLGRGAVLEDLHRYHALVIGPGLGREEYTVTAVSATVRQASTPVVVDGDGLFALAWDPDGAGPLVRRRDGADGAHAARRRVRTPRRPPPGCRSHRRRTASWRPTYARVVLLKGPVTVVGDPGGRRAASWLPATLVWRRPGTGDVLSGIVGALLATGMDPFRAAAAGAWVHAAVRSPRPGRRAWSPATSSTPCPTCSPTSDERTDRCAGRGRRSTSTPSPTTSA